VNQPQFHARAKPSAVLVLEIRTSGKSEQNNTPISLKIRWRTADENVHRIPARRASFEVALKADISFAGAAKPRYEAIKGLASKRRHIKTCLPTLRACSLWLSGNLVPSTPAED